MRYVSIVAMALCALAGPALAQFGPPPSPAPAPLLGLIGLPLAGLVLGAVWLVRRRANKS